MAPLRIGVMLENIQMSDIVCIDILGNLSTQYLNIAQALGPEVAALVPKGVDMEWLFLSSSLSPTFMTPNMHVTPTHTYTNCPRDLDMLILGGPSPTDLPEKSLVFLKEAMKCSKVIMSTCSGSMWLAASGILDGKKATTNKGLLEMAKTMFPKVKWMCQRWVVEEGHFEGAQIWTAGGAGCGIDMMADYCLKTFDKTLVQTISLDGLAFQARSQSY